jgi:hypothetical protein
MVQRMVKQSLGMDSVARLVRDSMGGLQALRDTATNRTLKTGEAAPEFDRCDVVPGLLARAPFGLKALDSRDCGLQHLERRPKRERNEISLAMLPQNKTCREIRDVSIRIFTFSAPQAICRGKLTKCRSTDGTHTDEAASGPHPLRSSSCN